MTVFINDQAAARIGDVDVGDPKEPRTWKNAAKTPEELNAHAKATEPTLRDIVDSAARESGGDSFHGPGNKFATKRLDGIQRKANDPKKPIPVENQGDRVRGTIIVNKPEQIGPAVKVLQEKVEKNGGKLVADNKWKDGDKSYSAVHADLLSKTPDGKPIRIEVQIQLRSIADGTDHSIKEQSENIYKVTREADKYGLTEAEKTAASQATDLLFPKGAAPHAGGG